MLRTFKYRLRPTRAEEVKLAWTLERCRLLYNQLLAERKVDYRERQHNTTMAEQSRSLPMRKAAIPALKEVYAQVLVDVVRRVDKTYQAFFRRVKAGDVPGFPRFKTANRYDSFTYPQHGFGLIEDGRRLHLAKIGNIRIKLHRQVEGTMKTCTIRRKNDKWYACLSCEVETSELPSTGKYVGVDVGLHSFAATSDGEFYEAPRLLRKRERQVVALSHAASRKKRGSNRQRAVYRQLARVHERVANQRRDHAHKVALDLVRRYDLIAFEDLRIGNMLKNHHLAKSIADAGWSQLVQFVTYKAEGAGRRVVLVDPKQTSQACSTCGTIVKKSLSVRVHKCPECGLVIDRDVNAAINILARAVPAQTDEVASPDEVHTSFATNRSDALSCIGS